MALSNILEDKIAVITGTSSGIGEAIKTAFQDLGARVADISMSNAKYICDVSDFGQTKTVCKQITEDFGGVDILVNNAGITQDSLLLTMNEEDFDRVIAVNLKGAFNLTKHLARPLLKSSAGRIINIASVVGLHGNIGQANYSASKAGLIGFTKTMAREFASRNVTVNAIAPGFIQSKMTEAIPASTRDKIVANIPLARMGTADDVANAAIFLASDMAAYMTGTVIQIDGGLFI
ncbi:MAG: 3-oxoacyl-ACP reductase FabG [Turicibacter sp.]|nr:3-oxoacyl-ACP reductase FabG [Turicibacter sp.]